MVYNQPRSQGLCSLPPLVVGTETLVAAGHVTIYPSKTAGWVGTKVHLVERTIKYHPVAPAFQQIFLPPRFWVVTWPAATRVSVPTTKGGREERPLERGWSITITSYKYYIIHKLLLWRYPRDYSVVSVVRACFKNEDLIWKTLWSKTKTHCDLKQLMAGQWCYGIVGAL